MTTATVDISIDGLGGEPGDQRTEVRVLPGILITCREIEDNVSPMERQADPRCDRCPHILTDLHPDADVLMTEDQVVTYRHLLIPDLYRRVGELIRAGEPALLLKLSVIR